MIRRLSEILFNQDLRQWLKFKIFNPSDKYVDEFNLPYTWDNSLLDIVETPKFVMMRKVNFSDDKPKTIRLASQFIDSNKFFDYMGTNGAGLSGEDSEALYRFNGVLLLAIEGKLDKDFFELNIDQWMDNFSKHSYAMESYVISERLANIGILVNRTGVFNEWSESRKQKFHAAIVRDLKHLASHLEYFGERLTGNHLSNNARGLAWGCYLNGNVKGMDLAVKMLINESQRIIEDNGIFIEGSTNYQSLIARNFLEISLISADKNPKLKLISTSLVNRINLVKPFGHEAFIGDISPDFPMSYFDDIASFFNTDGIEVTATGWVSHFKSSVFKKETAIKEVTSSYFRVDFEDTSLLGHFNKSGTPILAGHAHCDSGSLVAFHKGQEVLIDLGRKSYNEKNDPYIESSSHNYIEINKEKNERTNRGVYGPEFLNSIASAPRFELMNQGFRCIINWKKQEIIHTREVLVKEGKLFIKDQFAGHGSCTLDLFFHFPSEDRALKVESAKSNHLISKTKRAIDYGVEKDAFKLVIELGKVKLPYEHTTIIDCK